MGKKEDNTKKKELRDNIFDIISELNIFINKNKNLDLFAFSELSYIKHKLEGSLKQLKGRGNG